MQIQVITVPVIGGQAQNEELNRLLRSKKVLHVEQQLLNTPEGAMWCFCVKYLEGGTTEGGSRKGRVDYRQVLDEVTFKRFAKLREVRKGLAKEEGVPAYVIFTDEELSQLAKLDPLTLAGMSSINGIGEKKTAKYGPHFVSTDSHATSQSPTSPD